MAGCADLVRDGGESDRDSRGHRELESGER